MARRQSGGSEVLLVDDWSTVWRCGCGYGNAGRESCLMCGALAPTELEGSSGLHGEADLGPLMDSKPRVRTGRKAGRTVAAIIFLNLVVQAFEVAYFFTNDVERATAIRISLFTGLFCYALAASWVYLRSTQLGIRPDVGRSKALTGAAEGFVVGGAVAIAMFGILRIVTGHPVLDPTASLLAVQGSPLALILGILLVVFAAPVVEEFVFRGFLAEAMRDKGRRRAVTLSAVAFSLGHLQFSQFRYYVGMGVMLGLVYWRRGLVGSITAHATFNGMLVLMAVVASHGPALDATGGGSTVSVPATYQISTGTLGDQLVVFGPLGAQAEFGYVVVDELPPVDILAADLARGSVPFPGEILIDMTSVVILDLPAGRAVSMTATIEGEGGRMVVLPQGNRLWIAIMRSDGTDRAFTEFDEMLRTWRLSPTV